MNIFPGLILALALALGGGYLADLIGVTWMGLPKSPVSPIMMAILLGILVRNTLGLAPVFQAGVRFSLVRILRLGIVLLGIRLSLGEAGEIGLKALPVIIGCVTVALLLVTWLSRRLGLSGRLGTLIAAGTAICGATAIVALSPSIKAKDDETAYAVACVTLFGVVAMLTYPFAAHWLFSGDPFRAGLFLGTSVHETAQVAGAGLVYQEYFGNAAVLDAATVTKLVRNLGMLIVIPLLSILYHRKSGADEARPGLWSMVPLFVIGFALMSLLRTVGDMGERPFGLLDPAAWKSVVSITKDAAEYCLGIAMAAVGLGTSLAGLKEIGVKPLGVGLFSAVLVGGVSYTLIALLY
jgi:uncharacterized integral membrane protein (TIGR00698 family)